jgi:hypothetical protein
MDVGPLRAWLAAHRTPTVLLFFHNCLHESAGRSELQAPIDRGKVLKHFIERTQPWRSEGVELPRRLRRGVWTLIPVELTWAFLLMTMITGASPCDGLICLVATLNHHAFVLLICASLCIAGLALLVPFTRGLAQCNGWQIAGVAAASAAGATSLLGVAALMIGTLIVLLVFATFLLAFTATSRREIDDARPRTPFPIAVPRGGDPTRARRAEPPS